MSYDGWLNPYMPQILALHHDGATVSEIAAAVLKSLSPEHRHYVGTLYSPTAGILNSLIRYALSREGQVPIPARRPGEPVSKWAHIVPPAVAAEQIAWERRRCMVAMHDVGNLNWSEIGRREGGLSRERVRQIGLRWERERARRSPVERFLATPPWIEFTNMTTAQTQRFVELVYELNRKLRFLDPKRDWLVP